MIVIYIILGLVILGLGRDAYVLFNTRDLIEYHQNGLIKLKGKTRFRVRFGVFYEFNEIGLLITEIHYNYDGTISKHIIHYKDIKKC